MGKGGKVSQGKQRRELGVLLMASSVRDPTLGHGRWSLFGLRPHCLNLLEGTPGVGFPHPSPQPGILLLYRKKQGKEEKKPCFRDEHGCAL